MHMGVREHRRRTCSKGVATVTWQYVFAGKTAFADVSVSVEVWVPELVAAAVNVVVPHPNATGVDGEAIDAVGSTIENASPMDR